MAYFRKLVLVGSMSVMANAAYADEAADRDLANQMRSNFTEVTRYKLTKNTELILSKMTGRPATVLYLELTPVSGETLSCGAHIVAGKNQYFTYSSADIMRFKINATKADLQKAGCGGANAVVIWE